VIWPVYRFLGFAFWVTGTRGGGFNTGGMTASREGGGVFMARGGGECSWEVVLLGDELDKLYVGESIDNGI